MKKGNLPLTPIQQVLLEKALEIYLEALQKEEFHERSIVTKEYLVSEVKEVQENLKVLTSKGKK